MTNHFPSQPQKRSGTTSDTASRQFNQPFGRAAGRRRRKARVIDEETFARADLRMLQRRRRIHELVADGMTVADAYEALVTGLLE